MKLLVEIYFYFHLLNCPKLYWRFPVLLWPSINSRTQRLRDMGRPSVGEGYKQFLSLVVSGTGPMSATPVVFVLTLGCS